MSISYARPLLDHETIEGFLTGCLQINNPFKCHNGSSHSTSVIAKKIRDAESAVGQTNRDCTLTSLRNRVPEYRADNLRAGLRETILKELIQLDRLDSDDEIKIGNGGAKPKLREPEAGQQAYIITGLPASGKSALVNAISDKLGAIILDSDFAKRKLPEFDDSPAGANLVHKESSTIVFGDNQGAPSLFGYCKENGFNIVIPKIGHDYKDIQDIRSALATAGYKVHLTGVLLARGMAASRALGRFLETGRYVPLGLIFDGYANDPIMNYYKCRLNAEVVKGEWASFGAIDTDKASPSVVDCTSNDNPVSLLA
ncbi:MAG: zeta toxin family protein [Microcoleus sp.]